MPYVIAATGEGVADDDDLPCGDVLTVTALVLPAWPTLDWTPGAIAATLRHADGGRPATLPWASGCTGTSRLAQAGHLPN